MLPSHVPLLHDGLDLGQSASVLHPEITIYSNHSAIKLENIIILQTRYLELTGQYMTFFYLDILWFCMLLPGDLIQRTHSLHQTVKDCYISLF